MSDLLRKAVELADGFDGTCLGAPLEMVIEQQWYLDALAAQLKRQIMAHGYRFESVPGHLRVRESADNRSQTIVTTHGDDDSMNVIEASVKIYESGVLE